MCTPSLTYVRSQLEMTPPKDYKRAAKRQRDWPEETIAQSRSRVGQPVPNPGSGCNSNRRLKTSKPAQEASKSRPKGTNLSDKRGRNVDPVKPTHTAQAETGTVIGVSGPTQSVVSHNSMRAHPTPFTRQKAPFSTIKDRMDSIHTSLWASLRRAFTELDYQWDEPAKLRPHPSKQLETFYALCVGPSKCRPTTAQPAVGLPVQSLDLFSQSCC